MYDDICKQVLSNKMILAWIMKGCMIEYREISVEEIAKKYMEGKPYISSINVRTGENIQGMPTEGRGITEGKVFYDIRFRALIPGKDEIVELIINVEAQNDYYPGYPIVTRGVYYGCSMISGQYGIEFTKSEYSKIKKVYSIWFCTDAPKYRQNSITSYDFKETNHIGNICEKKKSYDLISVVMVCLSEATDEPSSNILKP